MHYVCGVLLRQCIEQEGHLGVYAEEGKGKENRDYSPYGQNHEGQDW